MTWNEAREGTVRQWQTIRDLVGAADPVELLTEVNAICDLCEKSDEVTESGIGRCERCLFYQQFDGCKEVSARISLGIVEKDWQAVRAQIDDMIAKLLVMEVPSARHAA